MINNILEVRHEYIQINGGQLHVARAGQGRPLLFLHGWPEFWLTWLPVMERLADSFEIIAPDLRGFGESDKPMKDFGPDDQAGDIAALIGRIGCGPVGLVSHDIGGTVGQSLARSHPELMAGLFFFNFVYPGIGARANTPAHLINTWHTYFNQSPIAVDLIRAAPGGVALFITHIIKLWAHHPEAFDDATMSAFVENMAQPGNLEGGFSWYRAVAALRAKQSENSPQPAPIAIPTCVRWTECDKALDIAWADRLAEFFSDLDYAPFPDAGHFPHHEQPDRAAAEIARFYRGLDPLRWQR